MSSADRPDKSGRDPSSDESPIDERGQRQDPRDDSDFGSFVSSSVRNSFRQLKRNAEINNPTPPGQRAPRGSKPRAEPPARVRRAEQSPEQPSTGPVGRRWRDALSAGTTEPGPAESEPAEIDQRFRAEESERFDLGSWFRETFFDDDGPNRKFITAIGAVILIVLLVVFLMARDGDNGGSGGDTITPTATNSSVLTTDRTATSSEGTPATSPSGSDTGTAEVTPTSRVLEGGDNQRDNDDNDGP